MTETRPGFRIVSRWVAEPDRDVVGELRDLEALQPAVAAVLRNQRLRHGHVPSVHAACARLRPLAEQPFGLNRTGQQAGNKQCGARHHLEPDAEGSQPDPDGSVHTRDILKSQAEPPRLKSCTNAIVINITA
jgi:hypothetical protein